MFIAYSSNRRGDAACAQALVEGFTELYGERLQTKLVDLPHEAFAATTAKMYNFASTRGRGLLDAVFDSSNGCDFAATTAYTELPQRVVLERH